MYFFLRVLTLGCVDTLAGTWAEAQWGSTWRGRKVKRTLLSGAVSLGL